MTLQSGQSYSADQMAELLGVSRRTIFRDLNEVSGIGVPDYYDLIITTSKQADILLIRIISCSR